MPVLNKHYVNQRELLRDIRPASVRVKEYFGQVDILAATSILIVLLFLFLSELALLTDFVALAYYYYVRWVVRQKLELPFKMPKYAAPLKDPHNSPPGKGGAGKSEGIFYLGNVEEADNPDHGRELWLTNNDARTHILFLGTTGSGKTEALKSMAANALSWGSGFVYIDGKADTDLWAALFSLARRFGRDDDLLVLNYMTANSDNGSVSNTMNPFSNGSASYLTNMVVSLMPDAGGDNAMWKERAIALLGALMPALTWKRDKGGLLLDVGVLRDYIELPAIIKLSRDPFLPERVIRALRGYLTTLPGYVDEAFDDEGNERPPTSDQPMYDLQVARQQHGYLSMQFTRSLQSLADEYGYIFKAQLADVDVLDIVLNRRILVGLIPSLEKSGDEAANLGKIVVASLKGMMGATLGNTVEGSWENAIGSKQTRSQSSFMTVFDEVGYYTAQGMAVMAAQARSLGFSLVFAAQDLPSMEKRVKQEAQSILANCNLKIFGKVEDPGDTKKFFSDHVGVKFVVESTGMEAKTDTISSLFMNKPFYDKMGSGGPLLRPRAAYDHLRNQREGEAHVFFAEWLVRARLFFVQTEKVHAIRVHKLLPVPPTTSLTVRRERIVIETAARLNDPQWTAAIASAVANTPAEIGEMAKIMGAQMKAGRSLKDAAMAAIAGLANVAAPAPISFRTAHTTEMPSSPPSQEGEQDKPFFVYEEDKDWTSAKVPSDFDTRVVPRIEVEQDTQDVTKLKLPEDISAYIESMAGKFNAGLEEDSDTEKNSKE